MARAGGPVQGLVGIIASGLLGASGLACGGAGGDDDRGGGAAGAGAPAAFDHVAVRFERNPEGALDIVVEAIAPSGMRRLAISDPTGARVLDHSAADAGADEVRVQWPAPAAPRLSEGTYRVEATTGEGLRLSADLALLLDFVAPPDLRADLGGPVHPDGVVIQWTPAPEAAGYVVEIEHEEAKVLTAHLLASADRLAVPEGILRDGTTYEVNVAAVSATGNRAETEMTIVTGRR
jgi:hypothetical protein